VVSVNVSVRLDDRLAERLRLRARAAGESLSDRLRRYAEEGARRDEHPMITFRDGPTGRRAVACEKGSSHYYRTDYVVSPGAFACSSPALVVR